ncbi:MAG: hypothetical protein NVSMB31_02050 [Vulcanimicrobiaceae bacterium]
MIDVYAPEGAFSEQNAAELLQQLAECFLRWTDAGDIPMARDNTGVFLHVLPPSHVTAGGKPSAAIRIDVKTPEVVLSTVERRRGFIADATKIANRLALGDDELHRTWVTIMNTVDGGWGIGGHGLTNAELDEI